MLIPLSLVVLIKKVMKINLIFPYFSMRFVIKTIHKYQGL